MEREILLQFQNIAGMENVQTDELMKPHTTFRIGGPADYFIRPGNPEQIAGIIRICREQGLPWFVLGNGSNLLVSDSGYRGVVIQIYKNFSSVEIQESAVRVQAGALLSAVAKKAQQQGLSGMEFASGIPGTLGGAVMMNAGAYGGEMKDILREVSVLTGEGEIRILTRDQLKLGYRTSIIKEKGYVVLEAVLELKPGDPQNIEKRMEELKEQRVTKQPLEYPSAGSTFKRPEGYFAGKLIMDSGLRGYRVGDAQVSEKHCGFVINRGNATAEDVLTLIRDVQEAVYSKFQVKLETEIRFLGDF